MSLRESNTVRQVLKFFKDFIENNTHWTEECEKRYQEAMQSLEELEGYEWSSHGPY